MRGPRRRVTPLRTKGLRNPGKVGAPPPIANAMVDTLTHLRVPRMEPPFRKDRLRALPTAKAMARSRGVDRE